MLPEGEKKSSSKLTESLKTEIGQSPRLCKSFLTFRPDWFVGLITKMGGRRGEGIIQLKKMLQNAKLPKTDTAPTMEVKKTQKLLLLFFKNFNI